MKAVVNREYQGIVVSKHEAYLVNSERQRQQQMAVLELDLLSRNQVADGDAGTANPSSNTEDRR